MSLVTTLGNFLLGSKATGVGVALGFGFGVVAGLGDGFAVACGVAVGDAGCALAVEGPSKLPEMRAITVKSTGICGALEKNLTWEKRALMWVKPLGLIL